MSRSYKKNPIYTDHRSGKQAKRFANKKVRKYNRKIANGKSYRKIYNSYDIHDYICRETYQEHRQSYESDLKAFINGGSRFDPRDSSRWNYHYNDNYWAKIFKRK